MEVTKLQEEAQADVNIWKYIFGFVEMAAVKCAIELGIPDILERNGSPMTLSELSSALGCTSPSFLSRLLRFLAHHQVLSQKQSSQGTLSYSQTPLSRRLVKNGENSMADLVLLMSSPQMMDPWQGLSSRVLNNEISAFDATNGEDIWSLIAENSVYNKLFNDGMACHARAVVNAMMKVCPRLLDGSIKTLVDVGGGNGTTVSMLVKAFPWVHGINFDLPQVVSVAPVWSGVEHVAGNMFESIPKANAAFLMWILHDWGDEECIKILKRCKEAIYGDNAKVIIVDAVVGDKTKDDFEGVKLMVDMAMMAYTSNGKERTIKEWKYIIKMAGFNSFTVKQIRAMQSVIEVFP